jgi:hypothetical protein
LPIFYLFLWFLVPVAFVVSTPLVLLLSVGPAKEGEVYPI